MKKWLPLLLALLMLVTVFGCTKPSGTQATPTPLPVDPGTEESTEPDPTEEVATSKYTDEITVDFAHMVESNVEWNDRENDALCAWVYDRYKIVWDMIPLDWSSFDENVRVWANAGDLPTQCFWNYSVADYKTYADQGLIAQFPDGWQETYPNLYTTWKANGISEFVDGQVGGTYAQVHAIYFEPPINPYTASWTTHIRQDWVAKLGFEVKTVYTWTEFEEIMNAILANYETLGLTKGTDYVWAQEWGNAWWAMTYSFDWHDGIIWDADAQQYVYGPEKERDGLILAMETAKRGYETGWFHQDLFTFTSNREAWNLFYAGNSFTLFQGSFSSVVVNYWRDFENSSGLDPNENTLMIIVTDAEGKYHNEQALNYWAGTIFNPNIDADVFARLLDLGNYRLGDEGKYVLTLGIEGVDWEWDGDKIGVLREVDEETGTYVALKKKYPIAAMFETYFICADDYGSYDPTIPADINAQADQTWADKHAYGTGTGSIEMYDYYYNTYSSAMKDKFNLDLGAMVAQAIANGDDMATALDSFIATNRTLIDEVLADVNANLTPQRVAAGD